MLLPKRVKRRKRKRAARMGSYESVKKDRYDFVETDDMVSKFYKDELGVPVSVTTKIASLDPLVFEHTAIIDSRKMKMADCTYRNALELMLYRKYKVVDISVPIIEDGEVFYEVTGVPLSKKIEEGKRRTLQTKIN